MPVEKQRELLGWSGRRPDIVTPREHHSLVNGLVHEIWGRVHDHDYLATIFREPTAVFFLDPRPDTLVQRPVVDVDGDSDRVTPCRSAR